MSPPIGPPPIPPPLRTLGRTGLRVPVLGYGAVKIGRNQGVKYPRPFDLPDEAEAAHLLNTLLDWGVTYIDTAPAYGLSETRIGRAIAHRRQEFVLSTKVGETFQDGQSRFDFSADAVRASITGSLRELRTDVIDLVYLHSDGHDLHILDETDALPTLLALRDRGLIRSLGLSGKTVAGARRAIDTGVIDVLMIPLNLDDQEHSAVLDSAHHADVGITVKKGLGSGWHPPADAIGFVLGHPQVHSLVIGGLNLEHLRENIRIAAATRSAQPPPSG